MKIHNFLRILILSLVILVGLFAVSTPVSYAGGVAMQVKVRYHLNNGTIINNPPTDIRIQWDRNPNQPEDCGGDGSLFFGAADPPQGQSSSNDGASWQLYREGGTREAYRWIVDEDGESPTQGQWVWLGRSDASVGPCPCINRRATITLNGQTQTVQFKANGQPDGGPFNNWSNLIAEFDFNEPTPTPTPGGTVSIPELGDLTIDAGSTGRSVTDVGLQSEGDVKEAPPRRNNVTGKRATFDGGNFYNPLDITQKITLPANTSPEDLIDYIGVAFGHEGNGVPTGTEPFTSAGPFDNLKRFVAVPPTQPSGSGLILLYAYNTVSGLSNDQLFTSPKNPTFEAGNYYIYLPEGLNKDQSFGQWYLIPKSLGGFVDIPGLANGNGGVDSCNPISSSPTCYATAKIGTTFSNDPRSGSIEWEITILPKMGSSTFTEVSFLKPKEQNKVIYKRQDI